MANLTDREVVLLARSSLAAARNGVLKPFTRTEWVRVEGAARARRMSLPELAVMDPPALVAVLGLATEDGTRLRDLLARHTQLAFELERLERLGIWVQTVADPGYPKDLLAKLGSDAPPVLFGAGDIGSLTLPGLGVVGSRDADPVALDFAAEAGRQAAEQQWATVSGGARGIDQAAMRGAHEHGGVVVAAVAEGVERRLRDASTRSAVRDGRAVVVSPYRPDAVFSVGTAMGRNKLIHGLASVSVVVSSAEASGGTWAGAVEALEHGWGPVYVRVGDRVPVGNRGLIARGAVPLPEQGLQSLAGLVTYDHAGTATGRSSRRRASAPETQLGLFDEAGVALAHVVRDG
ncbi:MAG: DNA-processing protein DprA [Chloroflexi bacterium]|nr:DNA-processing protein DprA [Chloroflexota bacterium]